MDTGGSDIQPCDSKGGVQKCAAKRALCFPALPSTRTCDEGAQREEPQDGRSDAAGARGDHGAGARWELTPARDAPKEGPVRGGNGARRQ